MTHIGHSGGPVSITGSIPPTGATYPPDATRPPNVERFVTKWQPQGRERRRAFWKEFRKAANAYAGFRNRGSEAAEG